MAKCSKHEDFVEKLTAINNNGDATGSIYEEHPDGNCMEHGYIWANGKNIQTIPFMNSSLSIDGGFLFSISSDLKTSGISFAKAGTDNFTFGTLNNNLNPSTSLVSENYPQQISENGKYVAGFNFGGQIFIYSADASSLITDFKLNGKPMEGYVGPSILYSVSNNGIAVGTSFIVENSSVNFGITCNAETKECNKITPDSQISHYITAISSNGKHILGFTNDRVSTTLIKIDPETKQTVYLANTNGFMHPRDVTENGIAIIEDEKQNKYFYNSVNNSFYPVAKILANLQVSGNLDASKVALSPNGKFLIVDSISTRGDNFGAKIYFPNGIENYLAPDA